MTTVEFRGLDDDGQDQQLGTLSWNGTAWSATGEPWIADVPKKPIWGQGKQITADDPEAFLRELGFEYRSPYCRALKAVTS